MMLACATTGVVVAPLDIGIDDTNLVFDLGAEK